MKAVVTLSIQRVFLFRDVITNFELNPYYVVHFNNRTYVSETCRRGNHSPSWNESFSIALTQDSNITIDVYNEEQKVYN
jgi:Ca2+-dependent lipid-binding protein